MAKVAIVETGMPGQMDLLIGRLKKLPGFRDQMIAEAVPTLKLLLSSATGSEGRRPKDQVGPLLPGGVFKSGRALQGPLLSSGRFVAGAVPPQDAPWAGRRYVVAPDLQARIDANTRVQVVDGSIRVDTGSDNPHLRPVVPVGELPRKFRAAIAAKINGAIRRQLKGTP